MLIVIIFRDKKSYFGFQIITKYNMNIIPHEILQHIFEFNDIKTLLTICFVSREWKHVADKDLLWIKLIRDKYTYEKNIKVSIINYCKKEAKKKERLNSVVEFKNNINKYIFPQVYCCSKWCTYLSPIALILMLCFLGIWFGIFFGINFHEINIKENWVISSCTVIDRDIGSYRCCERTCSLCNTCSSYQRTCSNVINTLPINMTESCCDGPHCCSECCDTCTICDTDMNCNYYSCNCYCCQQTPNLSCSIHCRQCWRPTISILYNTTLGLIISYMGEDCSTSFACVNNYYDTWQIGTNHTCSYNPKNFKEFSISNQYTPWKFGIMAMFSFFCIVTIVWCLCVFFISIPCWITFQMRSSI